MSKYKVGGYVRLLRDDDYGENGQSRPIGKEIYLCLN